MDHLQGAERVRRGLRAPKRWVTVMLAALLMVAGMGWLAPADVAAGQAATITTQGAPLFADFQDYSVVGWMDSGSRVDVFWGPEAGLYEVRYYGTVGWTWAENLVVDGAATSASSGQADPGGGERWIDVNRSTGAVTLYEGSNALYVFWGSLSRNSSNGFYATASGTWYVYSKYRPLSYTPYADNYISDWVGFDEGRLNGFHSWTKDANGNIIAGGSGYTAGCVSLAPGDIDILFDFAYIGMRVEVHW